ncbi:MAG: glycosyltransferase family 4 protein [Pirellulales bacterium]
MMTDLSTTRPGLAIIANCIAPYRVYLHTQVAERIPELQLHTLITHGAAEFDWKVDVPASINTTYFGAPGESPLVRTLSTAHWEWRKGGRIIRYLQENNVRAVIMNGYHYVSYLRVINYCHRAGIPLFGRNDSNIRCERRLSGWKRWLKARVYSWWIPRTAGIMSMGQFGDEFFLQYGADRSRMYRVPCLPDLDLFARGQPEHLGGFRRKYGLRQDRRYLLYSGRLAPQKRVDLLVDAFAAVADARPEWDLIVVGDGLCGDDLRRRVPERLRSRVIWTGFQELEGCVAAYHAADVFVLPSDREPWAVVVQEAMAAGLPVVSSDVVGAARDLVEDRVSGRIFPVGNGAALEQAILDVTDAQAIADYQRGAKSALAEWRVRVDPVAEIRRALVDCRVIGGLMTGAPVSE